jgi:ABC-type transport system substrate-binding protein
VYNVQDWQIPGTNTIVIGVITQPGSLYTVVDTSYIANLAAYPINPRSYRSLNYSFTPQLTIQHSTIANGLASNNDVLVEIGDLGLDSSGNVVTMQDGTPVIDALGNQVAMDAGGVTMKQLVATYTWRNDLYWSDGVKLNIADFQLGYQVACDRDNGGWDFYTCDRTQGVQFATNGTNTYTVTYLPGYQNSLYYLAPYNYYPAHRVIASSGPYYGYSLNNVPPSDWPTLPEVTQNPIGVGPYKLVEWDGEHIRYEANPYAPADLAPTAPNLTIQFLAPEDAESLLVAGAVDLLGWDTLYGLSQQLVEAENLGFVKNFIIPGATWEHADFNQELVSKTVKPTTDPNVRKAIAHCTDKAALAMAGYGNMSRAQAETLVMNSWITRESPFYAGDGNLTLYEYDPDTGRAMLDAAGWTLQPGAAYRTNADGEELALKFTATNASFRMMWGQEFETQMLNCGIRLIRQHFNSQWWFGNANGLQMRDFELGEYAWVGQTDPGGETLFACDQIPGPLNNWIGQNFSGWCNPTASQAIKRAVRTVERAQRVVDYKVTQQEYTADIPTLPLFNRASFFSTAAALAGFAPTPGEDYYVYNVHEWQIPGDNTIMLGVTTEPATLYDLQQGEYTGWLATYLINPRPFLSLDYEYTPQLLLGISTVENGLAQNNNVLVNIGDSAVAANGEVATMTAGTQVYDMYGTQVAMDSGGVWMKQLVVPYRWRNDLKWSDGVPLTIQDFQLGYQVTCDRGNGAWDYYICDRTKQVQFATDGSNTYTVTYLPGHQDPLYYLPSYSYYPAHRVITSSGPYNGYLLKNVPPVDWPTLPEVTENPIGVGPYKLTLWLHGVLMYFVANPYAPADLVPLTPNLVINFLAPENVEGELINGDIDVLGSDSLGGLSNELIQAAVENKVRNDLGAYRLSPRSASRNRPSRSHNLSGDHGDQSAK